MMRSTVVQFRYGAARTIIVALVILFLLAVVMMAELVFDRSAAYLHSRGLYFA